METTTAAVEAAGTLFAMSVLAWVIYRLTWTLVRIFAPDKAPPDDEAGT